MTVTSLSDGRKVHFVIIHYTRDAPGHTKDGKPNPKTCPKVFYKTMPRMLLTKAWQQSRGMGVGGGLLVGRDRAGGTREERSVTLPFIIFT